MKMAHVRLTYDGPGLQSHSMDVRILSPALLAFGDLCEDASKALFGTQIITRVEVKASFKTGSFGIDLNVSHHLLQQVVDLLAGKGMAAAANAIAVLGFLGIGGKGLIGALRWLRNRPIKRIEQLDGKRYILTEDDDTLEVDEAVIVLLRSRAVRTNLQKVISPIESDDIDTVALGDDGVPSVVIERHEAPYFVVPLGEDAIFRQEVRTIPFSIVTLSFKDDNKWRLFDGQNAVYVTVADEAFLERVNRNLERFAKGDVLVAETRIVYWQSTEGFRSEYTIEHVVEHRPGQTQIPIPGA